VGSAVKGAIRKVPNPVVPVPDLPQLVMLAEEFKDLTGGTSGYSRSSSSIRLPALPAYAVPFSGDIPDSITHVFIDGDARIKMQIRRYDAPLTIVVRGSASVERGSRFEGLVALHALKRIQISDGVYLDNVVFVSGEKIAISAGTKLVGQCIAPAVAVGDGAVLKYPSIVLSSHLFSNPTQSITIGAGASVEGMVVLAVPDSASEELPTLAIPGSARVVGCVISTGRLTLEGFVTGSVLTRDFDFYEAPTRYLGWMHGGGIDRKALPSAFLLPPGLSGPLHLYVLDWL
jgi:hypothetical protein